MSYEELLKKAMEKLPKKTESKKRFVAPAVEFEFSGVKTIFKNFNTVLNILRRDSYHLSKYLFRELAVPGSIEGGALVFQRKLPRGILQDKVNAYIKEFVYCKICGEPDTKLAKEDRVTFIVCEACGAKYPVRNV
jgi:translation initiation factor 2 subunit 2